METETISVVSGDFLNTPTLNVKLFQSKIEHIRDILHSEQLPDLICQSGLQFSKYNLISLNCSAKISDQPCETEVIIANGEFLLPLEQFIFVMPPGTVLGATRDSKICSFSQRIQNWNVCQHDVSTEIFNEKWEDLLKNMAVENISPFLVYLKLFLKTTHYFIAMSKVGVHIYSITEPSAESVDEALELEDIIVAKLNGSREEQIELKNIITEILFDSATQNILHPGIEVRRHEDGDFLLVTLGLKMVVQSDCSKQLAVRTSEQNKNRHSLSAGKQTMAISQCSLQQNEAGQRTVLKLCADKMCSTPQTNNLVTSGDTQLSEQKECMVHGDEVGNSLAECDLKQDSLNIPVSSQTKLYRKIQTNEIKKSTANKNDNFQEYKLHSGIQEITKTGQSYNSKLKIVNAKDSDKGSTEFDDVELCMTVDIPSEEDSDCDSSLNGGNMDVSILCDVEMYSVTSPGHGQWHENEVDGFDNQDHDKSCQVHSQIGNKAAVLSENTNLNDKDLTAAIQNKFKNIRVYQNKKLQTAKIKETRNNCDKENSNGVEISVKPELETLYADKNIDVGSESCIPDKINHEPDKRKRFMSSVRKEKLRLMRIDPTVNLNNDNVYVLFSKKQMHASENTDSDLMCRPTYCCGLCSEKFTSYKDLISHTQSHDTNKIINVTVYMPMANKTMKIHDKCKECGHICPKGGECTREDEFLCEICGERFHSKRRLSGHQKRRHLPQKPRNSCLCHACGSSFTTMGALRRHQDFRHTSTPRITCSDCGKMFKTKSQIARHVRIHLGVKPFECIACGMRFGVKMRWREHMYLHSGLKPYSCNMCLQEFRHMSALSLHKKMHRLGKI